MLPPPVGLEPPPPPGETSWGPKELFPGTNFVESGKRISINACAPETFSFGVEAEDLPVVFKRSSARKPTGVLTKAQLSAIASDDGGGGVPRVSIGEVDADSDGGGQREGRRSRTRKPTGHLSKEQLKNILVELGDEEEDDEDEVPHRFESEQGEEGSTTGLEPGASDLQRLELQLEAGFARMEALLARLLHGGHGPSQSSFSPRLELVEGLEPASGPPGPQPRGPAGGPQVYGGGGLVKGVYARPWRQGLPPCAENAHDGGGISKASTAASTSATRPLARPKLSRTLSFGPSGFSTQLWTMRMREQRAWLKQVLLAGAVSFAILLDFVLVGVEVQQEAAGGPPWLQSRLCTVATILEVFFVAEALVQGCSIFSLNRRGVGAGADGRYHDGWSRGTSCLWPLANLAWAAAALTGTLVCGGGGRWDDAGAAVVAAARCLRLARFARLVYTSPSLAGLRGVLHAGLCGLRSSFWTLCLLVLITYAATVILTQGALSFLRPLGDDELLAPSAVVSAGAAQRDLSSIWRSWVTLFKTATGGSAHWEEAFELVAHIGVGYQVVLVAYMLASVLLFAGVLHGVLFAWGAELARRATVVERLKTERTRDDCMSRRLHAVLTAAAQGGMSISYIEFSRALHEEETQQILHEMMVDVHLAHRLFGMLQVAQRSVGVLDLVEGMLHLQGHRVVRSEDLYMLQLHVKKTFELGATPPSFTPKFGASRSSLSSRSFSSSVV